MSDNEPITIDVDWLKEYNSIVIEYMVSCREYKEVISIVISGDISRVTLEMGATTYQ